MDTRDINNINEEEKVLTADEESMETIAAENESVADAPAVVEETQDAQEAQEEPEGESTLSYSEMKAMFYEACYRLGEAKTIDELKTAEQMLIQLGDYPESDKKLELCREKIKELEKQKAEADAANAQRLEKLREEYTALRDEAKRCVKILKKKDAAKKLRGISARLSEKYSEIEGAPDYAREFSARADELDREYARRSSFEKISCATATLLEIAAAALYIIAFAKLGDSFGPFVPLTVCDCIMLGGFMIGYFCESGSGAYASLFAALGFAVMLIATIVLCIFNKLSLGALGYIKLIALPIVIGLAAGIVIYIVWSRFAANAEKVQKLQEKKSKK